MLLPGPDDQCSNDQSIQKYVAIAPNPEGLRIRRSSSSTKAKRPMNCFLLYRQWLDKVVPGTLGQRSVVIGRLWRNEPQEEKLKWKALAQNVKQGHIRHRQLKSSTLIPAIKLLPPV
ncbi:hypothetical protein B0O80DRAFT_181350 [Mortierella sp. GBAus27b]|nr:hypothetical protein B0O80DRAFT_181350 [Mortierella sp. GBAus27b]